MDTTSTAGQSARDAAQGFHEGTSEIRSAAAGTSGDMQNDLQAVREQLGKLAQQVSEIVASRGNAAFRRAKSGVDGVMADAQGKGLEAVGAVREVSDHFVDAIDESIKTRPYATLAIVGALGFLIGVTLRR